MLQVLLVLYTNLKVNNDICNIFKTYSFRFKSNFDHFEYNVGLLIYLYTCACTHTRPKTYIHEHFMILGDLPVMMIQIVLLDLNLKTFP
jgi:hypothetical protein